jgi:thioesterase domain-containing protein
MLLGHSRHGYSTLELARLLINSGKDVAFLGMLDTYPPGPKRQAPLADRVKIHLDNLRDKNLPEILQYARLSAGRFLTRWWRWIVVEDRRIGHYEKDRQANKTRNHLYQAYKPEPYAGQVTLFSATNRPWYVRWDMMENWANTLTGQLDIVSVPGNHMSMLEPPQVDLLAEKIEALLPQIDRE